MEVKQLVETNYSRMLMRLALCLLIVFFPKYVSRNGAEIRHLDGCVAWLSTALLIDATFSVWKHFSSKYLSLESNIFFSNTYNYL